MYIIQDHHCLLSPASLREFVSDLCLQEFVLHLSLIYVVAIYVEEVVVVLESRHHLSELLSHSSVPVVEPNYEGRERRGLPDTWITREVDSCGLLLIL